MNQMHVFIFGNVQGVGYRQFVKSLARKSGIYGWVRNLPDGRVEAVLQGEKKKIENIVDLFKDGPFLAEVRDVETYWEVGKALESFEIR